MAAPGPGSLRPKMVKFNPTIIETSFGGTQRACPMKHSNSGSSIVDNSRLSEDGSLPEMDRAFFAMDSPTQEPLAKRRVRSHPSAIFNNIPSQEPTDSPYRVMKQALKNSEIQKSGAEDSSGITVAVRVRPFTKREKDEPDITLVVSMNGDETSVQSTENGQSVTFTYDHSLWSFCDKSPNYADQQYTYETVAQPLLSKAFEGYNTCLFAYGQTGSGKSYSVMGSDEDRGIIPRFSEELFTRIEEIANEQVHVNVEISFFEIYNEKIHDLLTTGIDGKLTKRLNLKVREHPVTGPYVEGLSNHVISSYEDVEMWLSLGNKQRATASTGMNDKSSRSHSVFTMVLTQTKTEILDGETHEHAITSKINLIDLAGSERQSTAKTTGDRLKEGASINKSLLTLGKVISQLCDLGTCVDTKKRKVYIPYRDSVLTWLLKESLGGNSKTAMLATISPANICIDETISTLRYASQARYIVNKARINEDPKARLIRELKAEIDKLRAMMTGSLTDDLTHASSLAEIASLKSRLTDKEYAMMVMTRSWEERLKASEEKMKEETKFLEKAGIALKINKNLPYLVNLNEDPQLSETLVYVLQEGVTKVGQAVSSEENSLDIQLSGALIAPEHCLIHYNSQGEVNIEPILDALTYVNGNQVNDVTHLQHGDRVILGGDHYFRYHHPASSSRTRSASGTSIKDFHFAREELIQVQNAKMEAELAEVRRKTKAEMEQQKLELEKQAKMKLDQCLAETQREANIKLTSQKQDYESKLKQLSEKLDEKNIDTKIVDEVTKQASHLQRENEFLQQQVEEYKKQIGDGVGAVVSEISPMYERSDILSEIEAIKQQMNEEVERLTDMRHSARKSVLTPARRPTPFRRQRISMETSPDLSSKQDSKLLPSGTFQLYEVALMIREANKIATFLGKDANFSREDIDEGTMCVRVNKPGLGISTFWSVDKLSEKLLRMREMYEGTAETDDGADPFYDGGDTWEQDDRINSPAVLHKRLKAIRRSLSPKPRVPITKRLSFTDDQLSPLVLGDITTPTPADKPQPSVTIELCRTLLEGFMTKFADTEESTIVDMILWDLQELQAHFSALMLEGMDIASIAEVCVKLTSTLQSLMIHCRCWMRQQANLSSAIVSIYVEKLNELMNSFNDQTTLLLQGCASQINTMRQQAVAKCQQIVYQIAKLSGEFSLASQSHVTACFVCEESKKLSKALLTAFLSGGDLFVDKTLKGAIANVEESEFRIQTLRDYPNLGADFDTVYEQIEVLVASVRVLLTNIQETQVAMETVSVKSNLDSSYYGDNYKRLMGLVVEVSSISEQVRLLMQTANAVANGKEHEIERVLRCSDSLEKITGRLVLKCSLNTQDEFTEMNSCENDRIHAAAQEIRLSVQQLTQTVRRLIRTHPHLSLASPRASPAKNWRDNNGSPMRSPKACSRNLGLAQHNGTS